MEPLTAARILNELLAAEAMSLVPQLKRTTVFVSSISRREVQSIDAMIHEEQEHERWLVDAILNLGGYPNPVHANIAAGGIHYVELRTLAPLVLREKKNLIGKYERAAAQLAPHARSAALAATILERHRRHAGQLEQMLTAVAQTQ